MCEKESDVSVKYISQTAGPQLDTPFRILSSPRDMYLSESCPWVPGASFCRGRRDIATFAFYRDKSRFL